MEPIPTIYERIIHLIQSKKLTPYRFSQELGFAKPAKLYSILKGKNQPSYDTLSAIATVYQDIDCNWLLRGKGDAYLTPITNHSISLSASVDTQLLETQIAFLQKQVRDRDELITLLKEQIIVLRDVITTIRPEHQPLDN
ncbi:MAG: hypothetical protein QM669_03985 [Siphonobacter sp.]